VNGLAAWAMAGIVLLAYVISVAFYLRLLSSFVLHALDIDSELLANALTTAVLISIAIIGLWCGLGGLESMEESAVNIKLAIIAALLVGLIWFDINWLSQADNQIAYHPLENWTHSLQLLAGILLIVQALRPLGILEVNYDFDTRIRTMRYAQLISAAIYLLFIFLSLPLLSDYNAERDETAIIGISASVAVILPVMLIIAAVMSQFSAAVADTAGSDGLISEFTRRRINPSMGYLLVILLAIGITWTTSIFEIITIASQAFAGYFFCNVLWHCLPPEEESMVHNRLDLL
jgi:hypothetical protein